ncbi:universal stress protein [Halolamina sp. C58]|uniref:universal stress protein n=1 Tax=Halolamina sp. C58 TaxID=3421640 RepID=UPI003EB699AA
MAVSDPPARPTCTVRIEPRGGRGEEDALKLAAAHDAVLEVLYVVDDAVVNAYSGDEYVDEAEGPEHGLELAATLGATVHVLSIVDESSLGSDVRSVLSAVELEGYAEDAVDAVAAAAKPFDIPGVHTNVEHGTPASAIRTAIDDHDVDAVVMGTTGRGGVERILLGSVAEKTIRTAPVPVITVAHDE